MVMVSHNQFLDTFQSLDIIESPASECDITQVPDDIMLADNAIPALHKLFVMLFDCCEWTEWLRRLEADYVFVAEVCIADEEDIRHFDIAVPSISREGKPLPAHHPSHETSYAPRLVRSGKPDAGKHPYP